MTRRTLFFLAMSGLAGCARARRPRLNVYNWSAYVAESTIPSFEREFEVDVRYSTYESNEEMLAKAMTGNSGWDVVFPSNYLIEPMRENGLLAPIDHARLPILDHLAPQFRKPSWDPDLRHAVPYMMGASGIIYQGSLTPPVRSWADLWNPRLGGRVTMLDDPAEVIGACLKKLGHPLNSADPAHLDAARREAIDQKRLLRAYLNAEVRDQMVSGDIAAAQLWATTAAQAISAAPALGFVYPEEGFALYTDTAVILRESRRTGLAHRFIDYLLRPQVAADVVIETKTATVNAAAMALLPPELRQSTVLFPPDDVLRRGEWFEALPAAAQRLRDRIWTEIKAA